MECIEYICAVELCEVPRGLSAVLPFRNIFCRIFRHNFGPFFVWSCANFSLTFWAPKRRVQLNIYDLKIFLAVECSAQSLLVKQSSIHHKQAGLGVFAQQPFRTEEIIWYYYWSLVYSDVQGQPRGWKTYGEEITSVNLKTFEKWVLKVLAQVRDKFRVEQNVWIVQETLLAIQLVNHVRYLPGD